MIVNANRGPRDKPVSVEDLALKFAQPVEIDPDEAMRRFAQRR